MYFLRFILRQQSELFQSLSMDELLFPVLLCTALAELQNRNFSTPTVSLRITWDWTGIQSTLCVCAIRSFPSLPFKHTFVVSFSVIGWDSFRLCLVTRRLSRSPYFSENNCSFELLNQPTCKQAFSVLFCKLRFGAVGLSPSTCESVSKAKPTNLHGGLLMHPSFHLNWAYRAPCFDLTATVKLPLCGCIC